LKEPEFFSPTAPVDRLLNTNGVIAALTVLPRIFSSNSFSVSQEESIP
jgi:hypothetical protein